MLHPIFDSKVKSPLEWEDCQSPKSQHSTPRRYQAPPVQNSAIQRSTNAEKGHRSTQSGRPMPKRKSKTEFCNLPKNSYITRANCVSPRPPSNPYRIGTQPTLPALWLGLPSSHRDHYTYSLLAAFLRRRYRDISATPKYTSRQKRKSPLPRHTVVRALIHIVLHTSEYEFIPPGRVYCVPYAAYS